MRTDRFKNQFSGHYKKFSSHKRKLLNPKNFLGHCDCLTPLRRKLMKFVLTIFLICHGLHARERSIFKENYAYVERNAVRLIYGSDCQAATKGSI